MKNLVFNMFLRHFWTHIKLNSGWTIKIKL